MLQKLLLSVALVACVSAPGLADITQIQNWDFGLGSTINLVGGQQSASNISMLTLNLDQTQTQPLGLSAFQGGIPLGQTIQLPTVGTAFGGQPITLDLVPSGTLSGGDAVSFVTGLPLYTTVQSMQ